MGARASINQLCEMPVYIENSGILRQPATKIGRGSLSEGFGSAKDLAIATEAATLSALSEVVASAMHIYLSRTYSPYSCRLSIICRILASKWPAVRS